MGKPKSCKVGDYVLFIEHPYGVENEGTVIEVADESMVKVAAIDGKDLWVFTKDITHIQ